MKKRLFKSCLAIISTLLLAGGLFITTYAENLIVLSKPAITGAYVISNGILKIELDYIDDEYAGQYEVLWGTTSNPATTANIGSVSSVGSGSGSSYYHSISISLDLTSGTTYFFKVRRCHGSIKSDWSNVYSYTYKKIDSPVISNVSIQYSDFYIDGVKYIIDTPRLLVTCSSVSNASDYYVYIDGEFSNRSGMNTKPYALFDTRFVPGEKLKITVQAYSSAYRVESAISEVYEYTIPSTLISEIKLTATDSWSAKECKTLSLTAGDKMRLYDQLSPSTAINQELKWASSNPDVATVTGYGYITAVSEGRTVITCSAVYGDIYSTCEVIVTPSSDTSEPKEEEPKEPTGVSVSKKCGDNATWTLDETGLLKITGTGAVWNRNNYNVFEYSKYIKSVEISEGITELGEFTFSGCNNLTKIILPDSLESIKSAVFDCPLVEINIPKNVSYIAYGTFNGCTLLKQISVAPENVNFFSVDGVLFETTTLSLVCYPQNKQDFFYSVPEGIKNIRQSAFHNVLNLKNVILPNSIKTIGNSAFSYCENLSTCNIPEGVYHIGSYAFYSTGLKSIVLPSSLEVVLFSTFGYCDNLDYIVMPKSVIYIDKYAFDNCNNLTHINYEGGESEWAEIVICDKNDSFVNAVINYKSTHVHTGGLSTCTQKSICENCGKEYGAFAHSLAHFEPKSSTCKEAGWYAYEQCLNCSYSTFEKRPLASHKIEKHGAFPATCEAEGNTTYYKCSVCNCYFSDHDGNNEISLSETLTPPLGHNYNENTGLCVGCGKVKPGYCGKNITWTLNDSGVLYINGTGEMWVNLSWEAAEIKEVIIGDGVESISKYAFSGCTNLTKITIPDSLISIGENAFSRAALTEIVIPKNVTSIGKNAFNNCSNLEKMTIPFVGGSRTSNTILGYVFSSTTTSTRDPNSGAILYKTTYHIPSNLKNVSITDATKIYSNSFRDCSEIETISLPNTLMSVYQTAFSECENLKDIYYEGTQAEWDNIYTGTLSANLHILGTEITSILINKTSTSIYEGATETLLAYILPEQGTTKRVVWTSSNENVATVDGGVITGISIGESTITATTVNGKTASCKVYVRKPVTGVLVNKTSMTMKVGDCEELTATVLPSIGANTDVIWSSSYKKVATVYNGKVTAEGEGTAIITVTTVDGNKQAICTVTVVAETLPMISVKNVSTRKDTEVTVPIIISNNPGLTKLELICKYDNIFTFVKAEQGEALQSANITISEGTDPNTIVISLSGSSVDNSNGVFLLLTFNIPANVDIEDYSVELTVQAASNQTSDSVDIKKKDGKVCVTDFITGDLNGDGDINSIDAVLLAQYIADWDVELDEMAADCNGDGEINSIDAVLLAQYIAGWDVTLG